MNLVITGMMQNQKEAHRYSEANNLNAKTNSLEILKEEVGWSVKKSEYKNTNVWGL